MAVNEQQADKDLRDLDICTPGDANDQQEKTGGGSNNRGVTARSILCRMEFGLCESHVPIHFCCGSLEKSNVKR